VLTTTLALAGCSADPDEAGSDASDAGSAAAGAEQSYPRTVTIGDGEVELEAAPQRIAILSSDLASITLPLVGGDRVVAAPSFTANSEEIADELEKVETPLGSGAGADPEQVMATEPDLVLISTRHGSEQDAADILRGFDVPVAAFPGDSWSGTGDLIEQIRLVADLVGETERGEDLAQELEERREAAISRGEELESPSVIGIWSHSNEQMIASPTLMLTGLIREAGGSPVVDDLDVDGQIPADPEFLIAQAPEVIIVQTTDENGQDAFADLIDDPALADVPAIANGRVHYIANTVTSSSAGLGLVDGLEEISDMLTDEA
jgi:iron complex transport system substrate-binding protein